MKEEIYLFYKNILEPRIIYLKKYILWHWDKFRNRKGQTPEGLRKVKFKYLFIGTWSDLCAFKDISDDLIFVEKHEFDGYEWNPKYFYILLGRYDDVSRYLIFLRKLKIGVILDQTFMKPDNKKPIWKRRISVVEAIYADLITQDLDTTNLDFSERVEWVDFETGIFDTYCRNKELYKLRLGEYLKEGWEFSRLNLMSSAVLLESLAELETFETPPNVLIEQAVKTIKNYCDSEEYKFVNGLLERCLKSNVRISEV